MRITVRDALDRPVEGVAVEARLYGLGGPRELDGHSFRGVTDAQGAVRGSFRSSGVAVLHNTCLR